MYDLSAGITGTSDIDNIRFNIYPNPATSTITLETTLNQGQYYITNTLGQQVDAGQIHTTTTTLDLNLLSGIYIITLSSPENKPAGWQRLVVTE